MVRAGAVHVARSRACATTRAVPCLMTPGEKGARGELRQRELATRREGAGGRWGIDVMVMKRIVVFALVGACGSAPAASRIVRLAVAPSEVTRAASNVDSGSPARCG